MIPALLLAGVMFIDLTRYGEDHRLAWSLAVFLAGLSSFFGSLVVAALYYVAKR